MFITQCYMFITQCIPTVHIKYYSGHKNNSKQYMQGPWASRHTYSRGTEKNSALEDVQGCSEIQRQKIKQNDGTESLERWPRGVGLTPWGRRWLLMQELPSATFM